MNKMMSDQQNQAGLESVPTVASDMLKAVQVASVERVQMTRKWGGLVSAAPKLPPLRPGMQMLLTAERGGRRQLIEASAISPGEQPWSIYMRGEPWPMDLALANVKTDGDGHGWDLALSGTFMVADGGIFLRVCAGPGDARHTADGTAGPGMVACASGTENPRRGGKLLH